MDDHIEDDTLFRTDVDPTIVERPVVRYVTDDFIDDVDENLSHANIMSYARNNFLEPDAMFLKFEDDLDNLAGRSSSVGDNTGLSSKPLATSTPRKRAWSRLLELECCIAVNGCIPMTIDSRAKKPISPHVIRFSQVIGVCVRKTFSICCLKWTGVGRGYIEVVKGDLQMLTTFKEFQADCHRHFEKYSDPEEARANPPNVLSQPTHEDSQPLSEDEIYDQVLGKRSCYSKGLGWGPKSKAHKTTSASSSTTSCSQSATKREIQIQVILDQALERIELQDRNYQALASEMEQM
ncbi:CACTA en-spm transposon protein [Cucumis melo var. makuwa]|uniref:CACTA en-spm transposon protein n=1 Tax=Cucumis melo var. makuwa TaxID=1194695 RepID=A0A5D3C937_CUCMM|nr:CACTA en-spm transposon protein [Cucumis melo var. makuwa]